MLKGLTSAGSSNPWHGMRCVLGLEILDNENIWERRLDSQWEVIRKIPEGSQLKLFGENLQGKRLAFVNFFH